MSTSDTLILNHQVISELREDYDYNQDLGKNDNPHYEVQPPVYAPDVDLSGLTTPFKIFAISFTTILFLAMLGYVIYKRYATTEEKKDVELSDEDTIYGIDFENSLEAMEKKGNYYQCIRLRYLQHLRYLHDRRRIFWMPSKTPTQYVYEMNSNEDFRRLTNIFLKVRYGNYPADAELYQEVSTLCGNNETREGGDK